MIDVVLISLAIRGAGTYKLSVRIKSFSGTEREHENCELIVAVLTRIYQQRREEMDVGRCQTKYLIISRTHDYGRRQNGAPKYVSLDLPGSVTVIWSLSHMP